MTNRNENDRIFKRPSLWTMQSKTARKQILNHYINKYTQKEVKSDVIPSKELSATENLNQSKDIDESLQLQSTYQEKNPSSNVMLLDEFLRSLSIAYLGSNSLITHIDWRNERYCDLFSNLIDVDTDDVLSILNEIPSLTRVFKEMCTDEGDAGDGLKSIFLQTPSPEMLQSSLKELENRQFSMKVELALKKSQSSLHETKQSNINPDQEVVQTKSSDNPNEECGRINLDKNVIKGKLSTKPRKELQIGQLSTLVSDNTLKNIQRKISDVGSFSDTSVLQERGINKSKLISAGGSKTIFGNEIKSKKRYSINNKCKKQPITVSPPLSSHGEDIEINVYNDNGMSKTFTCSQNLLISKMGFFAQVSSTKNLQDFRITIHSDPDIFNWILSWIKIDSSKWKSGKPELTCLNVTPILISASELQITSLIESCLNFCIYNLNDIISYSAHLGSLDDEVISRLASMFSNVELTRLEDKSDKIISRLYCEMIMSLAQSKPEPSRGHFVTFPLVFKCVLCDKIVLKEHCNNITCLPEQKGIDYRGNPIVNHKIDTGWNITKYIKNLMKKYGSWEQVYWNMWAECHFLKCSRCNEYYSVKFTKQCATHLKNPIFKSLSNNLVSPEGIYPCCKSKAYRFDISVQWHSGCKNINHTPSLEIDRSYSDIQKIYKSIKPLISHNIGSKLSKEHGIRAITKYFSHLQSQSQCLNVGLLDGQLLKVEGYKRFPVKGWQDSVADRPCLKISSEESISDSAIDKKKMKELCPQSNIRTQEVRDDDLLNTNDSDSLKDVDEGDSSASLLVADEPKPQKFENVQDNNYQSILETRRISVKCVEKIEKKLKKSLNEMKSSFRINQDNLRDYEDSLTTKINALLCQRIKSTSTCSLDRFPHINLHTIMKNDKISNTGRKQGSTKNNVHSSDSEISVGSSVKTYCSTISSSARIYHSRTSNVWNSFIPLAGTFVRVEAEWQDTFNAAIPARTKTGGRKQDESVFINCLNVRAIPENKSNICRRAVTGKIKSASGKSCSTVRRSWKSLAPNSKISEIESYLSTSVFPTRAHTLVNTAYCGVSKFDQQVMTPPCDGKHNVAFTCGFTSSVNNDPVSVRNTCKENDYVNSIWMYDVRYKELDYLSCIYMPIPLQKEYDVVKGLDWQRLRVLEHEWKSFLKLMRIDENFERYFQHSAIKPSHYNANLIDKKKKYKQ